MKFFTFVCVCFAWAACTASAQEAPPTVHMTAQVQTRMGVRAAPLVAMTAPTLAHGYARVLDAGPLAALDAEIATAQSAAVASDAEWRRLQALASADQSASQRAVDAARAQAQADRARASLAARRVGLEWGPALARLSPAARTRLVNEIANGRAVLVRVDAPTSTGSFRTIRLRPDQSGVTIQATPLGAAAAADARLQTPGVLAIVRGAQSTRLPAGRLVRADAEIGSPEQGVLLARNALLRFEGAVWVYVRTGPETFERRKVDAARPVDDGWFAAGGFRAGEVVVVAGATSLFAAEQGSGQSEE